MSSGGTIMRCQAMCFATVACLLALGYGAPGCRGLIKMAWADASSPAHAGKDFA